MQDTFSENIASSISQRSFVPRELSQNLYVTTVPISEIADNFAEADFKDLVSEITGTPSRLIIDEMQYKEITFFMDATRERNNALDDFMYSLKGPLNRSHMYGGLSVISDVLPSLETEYASRFCIHSLFHMLGDLSDVGIGGYEHTIRDIYRDQTEG